MMNPVHRIDGTEADACNGTPVLSLEKLIWTGGMIGAGLTLAPFFTTWASVTLGLALTYITLLLGHSVGMHRMMVHRSFKTKPWLRYSLLYLGTLVGIGGPSRVIEIHDIRDWAQRQTDCHDFFSHNQRYLPDLIWQLFFKFEFTHPPILTIEPRISRDPIIRHLDNYWRWHQLGFAAVLFFLGGLPFVIWGIFLRVAVSTIGHWTITYICHNPGPGRWYVKNAGVQASDLPLPNSLGGFITHGECWHSNHHAFPESAQIGLQDGQIDPAWAIIRWMENKGLAHDVQRPRTAIEDLIERPLPKTQKL